MPSEFQPENPHPDTDGPAPISLTSIFVASILSALAVVLVVAVAIPRFMDDQEVGFAVVIGLAALTFFGVIAGGYWYRKSET